jgi:hypothetical protein
MWHSLSVSALAVVSCIACASGNDTIAEDHAFTDAVGRQCVATLTKTSASAPSSSQAVSCENGGKQCSAEASPCFQLNVEDESNQVRNCPACCKGTASSFVSSECSPLLCQVDADCVYARAKCESGACSCPNGLCE